MLLQTAVHLPATGFRGPLQEEQGGGQGRGGGRGGGEAQGGLQGARGVVGREVSKMGTRGLSTSGYADRSQEGDKRHASLARAT